MSTDIAAARGRQYGYRGYAKKYNYKLMPQSIDEYLYEYNGNFNNWRGRGNASKSLLRNSKYKADVSNDWLKENLKARI